MTERPQRTCLGCRRRRPQGDLRRLALVPQGQGQAVVFDDKMRLVGRGAWVCRDNPACLAQALRPGRLARAFRFKGGLESLLTGNLVTGL
ncbi:MAG: YlxR family protein [Deltaproteobacteria bacterium]|jgi:predicted RNA-binding protein YlxR (DUF448 family)|nr:YlxR family protein [Deltaproteobacteria bacterium]